MRPNKMAKFLFTLLTLIPVISQASVFEVKSVWKDETLKTRWQEDAGHLLYATVDGVEYLIAPNDDRWNSYYLEIVMEDDLDGDGFVEALISTRHSGNCCGPNYFVVSHRGESFFSVHTHQELQDVGSLRINKDYGKKLIEVKDRVPSLDPIDDENRSLLHFFEGKLLLVSKLTNVALLPALVEATAADAQFRDLVLEFDIDADGVKEMINCNFWSRWQSIICGDIETSSKGRVILSYGCSRIGFLSSKTSGLHDIVCGRSTVLKYNSKDNRYQ